MLCTLFSQCTAHKFHQFPFAVVKDVPKGQAAFLSAHWWCDACGMLRVVKGGCTWCGVAGLHCQLSAKFDKHAFSAQIYWQRKRQHATTTTWTTLLRLAPLCATNCLCNERQPLSLQPPPPSHCVLFSMLQSARVLWQISLTKGGIKKRTLSIRQRGKEGTGDAERIAAASGVKAFCHKSKKFAAQRCPWQWSEMANIKNWLHISWATSFEAARGIYVCALC